MNTRVMRMLQDAWTRMNPRERGLLLVVVSLGLLFALGTTAQGALGYLRQLDGAVVSLQDSLVNYTEMLATKAQVEEQYQRIAAQHSSKWSETEIQDRLKQEVYRLAQSVPPALDAQGIPEKITGTQGELVSIPELRQGRLSQSGDGFRQYTLSFSIPVASVEQIINYTARLLESPQSLRVSQLEMSRNWEDASATANVEITRTISDNPVSPKQEGAEGEELDEAVAPLIPEEWTATGCTVSLSPDYAAPGQQTLMAQAQAASATLLKKSSLEAGKTYVFLLDIISKSPCRVGVSDANGQNAYVGEKLIPASEITRRLEIQFTTPKSNDRVEVAAPLITLSGPDARVYIANMVLRPVNAP